MGWFDIHAHLTHARMRDDLDQVFARARDAGVSRIISNGLYPADNEAVLALAEREPLVRPALGFYPVDAVLADMQAASEAQSVAPSAAELGKLRRAEVSTAEEGIASVEANLDRAFAVGEIGLDGHWVPEAFWPEQERVFRRLVTLAMEADKAVIIHTRKREARALEILLDLGATRVAWHCFGGKVKLARRVAEAGHYLSIPANARRSQSFTRMLETLPREQLLLETDCPYLGPVPGERNEPANVSGTAVYAAELWGLDLVAVESQLASNFERLFGEPP